MTAAPLTRRNVKTLNMLRLKMELGLKKSTNLDVFC